MNELQSVCKTCMFSYGNCPTHSPDAGGSPVIDSATSGSGEGKIIQGDCLEVMRGMDPNSVDLILTDPPYFRVKNEAWDRQWDDAGKFLEWMGLLVTEWHRILRPNGSLYVFASPKMATRVEAKVGEKMEVLNRLIWHKEFSWYGAGGKFTPARCSPEALRSFYDAREEIIFAEHYGADNIAKGESGYGAKCDELRGFIFEPLRLYFCGEFEKAGMLTQEGKIAANVACGFSASPGGMASRHYFSQSQWQLPTPTHYEALRGLLNQGGGNYLARAYDDVRAEYETLRLQYETLRRPFSVTADVPFTDVWEFKTVNHYKGKHPCEKPADLLEHIIKSSSREGATVLDCFMGTGSTGLACKKLGRNFIGIELSEEYVKIAQSRLDATKSPSADG